MASCNYNGVNIRGGEETFEICRRAIKLELSDRVGRRKAGGSDDFR